MDGAYNFEPSGLEMLLTEIIYHIVLWHYHAQFVSSLTLNPTDRVLDYCCGSGILSKKLAKQLSQGELVLADVSHSWLLKAGKRLGTNEAKKRCHLNGFHGLIGGGKFDKIVVHFALHDFPEQYQLPVLKQLVQNLNKTGVLTLREPLGSTHGFQLFGLVNLLESCKEIHYELTQAKSWLMGEYAIVKCQLK